MKDLNISSLSEKLSDALPRLKRYIPLAFLIVVVGLYGFIVYRVNTLNSAEPSTEDVTAQSKTAQVPHIDPSLIQQLQSLQNNSTSVKALFDAARDNPFQE